MAEGDKAHLVEALEAVEARIMGDWDHPALVRFGPLSTDTLTDVRDLVRRALAREGGKTVARYRVDLDGLARVRCSVEVQAESEAEAGRKGLAARPCRASFWNIVEEDQVESVSAANVERIDGEQGS